MGGNMNRIVFTLAVSFSLFTQMFISESRSKANIVSEMAWLQNIVINVPNKSDEDTEDTREEEKSEDSCTTVYNGVDYDAVYDYTYYINKYSDLKKTFGDDAEATLRHFVNYGMKEGRQANADFNVISYANRYGDLRRAYKNNLPAYYTHYMKYGKREGRKATGDTARLGATTVYNGVDYSSVFDCDYYVSKYNDIKKTFNFDDEAVLRHFVNYGMKEGRQAKSSFNVKAYKAKYRDLRTAYGNDLKAYYIHYVRYGFKEGRKATGAAFIQEPITKYDGVDYSAVFDYNYYVNRYADLKNTFKGNDEAALWHFVNYGMAEGRQAIGTFNIQYYKNRYDDLKKAYGNNLKSYFMHYIKYGLKEKRNAQDKETWNITQYADQSGSQANFYTITSTNGKLIVIDGGTVRNAKYVKEVINKNGGYVDAWILTHPHPDHIGAFNVLYNDESIDIEKIYDNGLDYDYYDTVDYWWDEIETYKTYLTQTKGDERVIHATSGQEINIGMLNIKILHSYSDDLKNWAPDICNDSSLVFKVSLNEADSKSMLFVSDNNGKVMADYFIKRYGNDLKADYANMGHHGNNSLPTYFYEYVSPEMTFFDAPRWLVEGEKYDTLINMAGLDAVGIAHVDYRTAPNKIVLN